MVTLLEREMYTETGAARLLRVAPSTLHYWLEGRTTADATYEPIIRERRTGKNTVTWGEFVEAGLLRQYRRVHRVPMVKMRAFVDFLRSELGVPYPLAHARPYVAGRELLMAAQEVSGLGAEDALVGWASGQYVLMSPASEFFDRVGWAGENGAEEVAVRWRPAPDRASRVVVDPQVRFGAASVRGISTEILLEQHRAGEHIDTVADMFDLEVAEVESALAYELGNAAA